VASNVRSICAFLIAIIIALFASPENVLAAPNDSKSLDYSFLKENPWRKQKLGVDLSGIKTEKDLTVVRSGINDIVVFIHRLSSAVPGNQNQSESFTADGQAHLRLPPTATAPGRDAVRLFPIKKYDWEVVDDSQIAVTVDFGLIREKTLYSDRFVFMNSNGRWRFDRHSWRAPIESSK
jgi:hypothetical protein